MRTTRLFFAAALIAIPHSVTAAGIAISCAITTEDVLFDSEESPTPIRRVINGTTHFTITDSALVTAMSSPCDRIAGGITRAKIDVTCSFPAENNTQASIRIEIDRRLGVLSETWDIVEHDGTKARYSIAGICSTAGVG